MPRQKEKPRRKRQATWAGKVGGGFWDPRCLPTNLRKHRLSRAGVIRKAVFALVLGTHHCGQAATWSWGWGCLDSGSHPRKQDYVNIQESTQQAPCLVQHRGQKLTGGTCMGLVADGTLLFLQGQIPWEPHREGTLHSHLQSLSLYSTPLPQDLTQR